MFFVVILVEFGYLTATGHAERRKQYSQEDFEGVLGAQPSKILCPAFLMVDSIVAFMLLMSSSDTALPFRAPVLS